MINLLRNRVELTRQTELLADTQSAAATIAITRNPVSPSIVQITLSAGSTGTVTVTGTKDSSPQTEAVTFTSSAIGLTAKEFDTVTQLSCSWSSATPDITAKYSGKDGGSSHAEYTVVNNWPAMIERPAKSNAAAEYKVHEFGSVMFERSIIYMAYDDSFEPKNTDIIVDVDNLNNKFFVIGSQYINYSFGRTNHWRVIVEMRK